MSLQLSGKMRVQKMLRFKHAVARAPRAAAAVRAHIAHRLLMIIRTHTSGYSPSLGPSTRRLQWHRVSRHPSSINQICRRVSSRKQRITKRHPTSSSRITLHSTIRKCLIPSIRKAPRFTINWAIIRWKGGIRGNIFWICRPTDSP